MWPVRVLSLAHVLQLPPGEGQSKLTCRAAQVQAPHLQRAARLAAAPSGLDRAGCMRLLGKRQGLRRPTRQEGWSWTGR